MIPVVSWLMYTQNITITNLYRFSGFTMYLNIVLCLCQERGCRLTVWYQLIEGCSTAVHPLQDLELCPPTPSVAILLITITIRSLPSSVQCSLSLVSSTLYSVSSQFICKIHFKIWPNLLRYYYSALYNLTHITCLCIFISLTTMGVLNVFSTSTIMYKLMKWPGSKSDGRAGNMLKAGLQLMVSHRAGIYTRGMGETE